MRRQQKNKKGQKIIRRKWTNDKIIEIAKKYKTKIEWITKDFSSYRSAKRRKELFDKCTAHMTRIVRPIWYTDNDIINIARKYKYLKDFREKEVNYYVLVLKRKIKEKACRHMVKYSKSRSLSDKEIISKGNKYKLKSQWRRDDFPSFNEAERRGLIEKSRHGVEKNGKGKNKKTPYRDE